FRRQLPLRINTFHRSSDRLLRLCTIINPTFRAMNSNRSYLIKESSPARQSFPSAVPPGSSDRCSEERLPSHCPRPVSSVRRVRCLTTSHRRSTTLALSASSLRAARTPLPIAATTRSKPRPPASFRVGHKQRYTLCAPL